MIRLLRLFHRRRTDDNGASAVEYGLLIAAIAAVIAGIVFGLGGTVLAAFNRTSVCIEAQAAAPC